MIRICLALCVFFCVHKEPVISWSETNKLSWSDFKDKPDDNVNAVAITASGITFGFSIKQTDKRVISFTTNVECYFYPDKSWYKAELANDHILNHEQLHFNITELYARKFRQRIGELKVSNNLKKQLKHLHNTINKELAVVQDRYDTETSHSRNFEAQTKWDLYIAAELNKFSEYKLTN